MSSISQARGIGGSSIARERRMGVLLRYLIAIVAILFSLFPALWIVSSSLNPAQSLAGELIPRNASLANYQALLNNPNAPFLLWMWNSFKISAITAILSTLLTALSAYAFSRFRFRGRRTLLMTILLIQVFPNMLAIVALYIIVQQLGSRLPWLGLNTHGALIMVYLGGVMGINVWLAKGFFDTIPRELDESATVDGASPWQTYWNIILPLVRPILAVIAILSFIGTYSDFLLARVLLADTEQFTIAVGLYSFVSQQFNERWGVFAAGALLAALPIVAVYLILQDFIVGGLTSGAVKG